MEHYAGDTTQKIVVFDEIGPEDATNLAFARGSFVMYSKNEEVIGSGRYFYFCCLVWILANSVIGSLYIG